MKNILCRLFGHRVPHYTSLRREVRFLGTDGLLSHHYGVMQPCARCGEKFLVAKINSPEPGPAPRIY